MVLVDSNIILDIWYRDPVWSNGPDHSFFVPERSKRL
jgi:hypothetical protein